MGLATKLQSVWPGFEEQVLAGLRRRPWLQTMLIVLASGVAYGVGFKFSLSTFLRDDLAVCWPLGAMQVAVLLRVPRRHWLSMFTGIVISEVIVERFEPMDQILVNVIGNVGEIILAALALPAFKNASDWITQPNLIKRFIVWPMVLGPALTAFPVAVIYSQDRHVSYWESWARWFLGDMLGIVLWLPLGIVLLSPETYALFTWKALPRTVSLIGTLSVAGWAIFHIRPVSIAYVLMPLLLVIALKLGFGGSVIAVNILSVISAKGTLQHLGPFGHIAEPYSVTMLQAYLTISMLMCFPISIILLERDAFARGIKDAYLAMELLATMDGLTGLANRRQFDTVLQEEWRRALRDGEPVAILMIDVDCFKLFNDLYGHVAGDECLRRIACSIKDSVKRAGDLPARFGGEEFVILMPRTDLSGALRVAETVRHNVELMRVEHARNPHTIVTISVGCWSVVPVPDGLPESLIEAADQGLYCAKQSGRNRVATRGTVRDAPLAIGQELATRA